MTVDPETRKFLASIEEPPTKGDVETCVAAARLQLRDLQAEDVPKPSMTIEDYELPVGPTGTVPVRVFRPRVDGSLLPAVIYSHGGGWVVGDRYTHDRLVRDLATASGAAMVFVDFARSPQARFPLALEQVYGVFEWITRFGERVGIDASRVGLAGESAGGTLAAGTAMLAKERGTQRPSCQLLFYPALDAGFDTASYDQFARGYFLTRDWMRWAWDQYLPDAGRRLDPKASPLRAALEQLAHLPPALIITAENDVLRDEAEAYAHRLMDAHVPVTATRYAGAIHAFTLLNALAGTPAARAAVKQGGDFLRSALAA